MDILNNGYSGYEFTTAVNNTDNTIESIKDHLPNLDKNSYSQWSSLSGYPYDSGSTKCNKFMGDYLRSKGYIIPEIENKMSFTRKLIETLFGPKTPLDKRDYTVNEINSNFKVGDNPERPFEFKQFFQEITPNSKTPKDSLKLFNLYPFYIDKNPILSKLKENDIMNSKTHTGVIIENPEFLKFIFKRPLDRWLYRSANPWYGVRDVYLKDYLNKDSRIFRPIRKQNKK